LPLAVGDRFVLRDPGLHCIVAGAVALDVLTLPLDRRGAAAAQGRTLTEVAERPDLAAEVDRRGCVRTADLVRAGLASPDDPPPKGVVTASGWWISGDHWRAWVSALEATVAAQSAASPLHPGLPRSAAAAAAHLPDERLLDALVTAADSLVVDAHGVHAAAMPALPGPVASALAAVERQLSAAPFQAPEAADLAALDLDAAALAACVRVGALLTVAPGVYLLPDAPDLAAQRLATVGQPFTMSEAKAVLGTTRRIAVPLLELLDRLGRTRRVDETHRIVVQERL
jgi:selenocysteine-specific elongation factor